MKNLDDIKFNKDSTQLVITSSKKDTPFQIDTTRYGILKYPENFQTAFRAGSHPDLIKIYKLSMINSLPYALREESKDTIFFHEAKRVEQRKKINSLSEFLDNNIASKKSREGTVNVYYLREIKPN
jgi:hypothetical protein